MRQTALSSNHGEQTRSTFGLYHPFSHTAAAMVGHYVRTPRTMYHHQQWNHMQPVRDFYGTDRPNASKKLSHCSSQKEKPKQWQRSFHYKLLTLVILFNDNSNYLPFKLILTYETYLHFKTKTIILSHNEKGVRAYVTVWNS